MGEVYKKYVLDNLKILVGRDDEEFIRDCVVVQDILGITQQGVLIPVNSTLVPIGAPLNNDPVDVDKSKLRIVFEKELDEDYVNAYNKMIEQMKNPTPNIMQPKKPKIITKV